MAPVGRTAIALVMLCLMLALAGCGGDPASSFAPTDTTSFAPSPSVSAGTTATDLSAIACATEDPEDVGELTGFWSGNDHGVYYFRQVGDCLWWFGTDLADLEPGVAGRPGFANVASGRVDGTRIEVEWADLPMGDVLGGGGLTLLYDSEHNEIIVVEQRGDWQPYGASKFTRIEPTASPDVSPSESASP